MKIESRREHELALQEIDCLMTLMTDAKEDAEWLSILARAVEDYEKIHFPIPEPTPEEAAAFRAEEDPGGGGPKDPKSG